ncbi:shugoshin family protein [Aspergillus stella-maris]|uniref:shugoshin family protein n=1 Tax=Aspergillus stella-maris TaxID=1810926 RepID=UPI003CCD1A46
MARLNESTVSAEPIEILKRRFVRQNREIARVNSIQSLRIRSLESEVSHLLSENVSLREQVIFLTQDLERFEAAKTLHDGVYDVKTRLDGKLVELSNLISELGALPRRYSRMAHETTESGSSMRSRKSTLARLVTDATLERGSESEYYGRLPVIVEDKYYPRRTMNADEIQDLSNNTADMLDSSRLESSDERQQHSVDDYETPTVAPLDVTSPGAKNDHTESEHSLPPNLETRRKKRTGSAIRGRESAENKSTSLLDSKFLRKCGSKRKFSVEDAEGFFESPAEDDGFEFSRPVQSPTLSPQVHSASRQTSPNEGTEAHVHPKRKVLEPKNTNTNLLSPMKPTVTKRSNLQAPVLHRNDENSSQAQVKGGVSHGKNVSPKKPRTSIDHDKPTNGNKPEANIESTAETWPVRDAETPDVTSSADVPAARPSRRRGAVVSYAEPNLRDKMRRSTNELGPAVNGSKSRRSSSHTEMDRAPHEQRQSAKKSRNSSAAKEEHDPVANGRSQQQYSAGLENQVDIRSVHRQDQDNALLSAGDNTDDAMDAMDVEAGLITNKRSRRHSSNSKATGRGNQSRFSTNAISVEAVCNDLVTSCSGGTNHDLPVTDGSSARDSQQYIDASVSSMDPFEMTRGQRVAARRRSMML